MLRGLAFEVGGGSRGWLPGPLRCLVDGGAVAERGTHGGGRGPRSDSRCADTQSSVIRPGPPSSGRLGLSPALPTPQLARAPSLTPQRGLLLVALNPLPPLQAEQPFGKTGSPRTPGSWLFNKRRRTRLPRAWMWAEEEALDRQLLSPDPHGERRYCPWLPRGGGRLEPSSICPSAAVPDSELQASPREKLGGGGRYHPLAPLYPTEGGSEHAAVRAARG